MTTIYWHFELHPAQPGDISGDRRIYRHAQQAMVAVNRLAGPSLSPFAWDRRRFGDYDCWKASFDYLGERINAIVYPVQLEE